MYNQSGSRRWTHFRSALQLAIQRSAHKWTFEDFAECFPLYVEEDKNGASATFNSISEYIESQNVNDLEKLFKDYSVQENIDILHTVVNEAKERKARGEVGQDVWTENLEPRVAVCARTVPILESEVKRLRKALAAMEQENKQLQAELEENVTATANSEQRANELLDKLESVYQEWQKLPTEEIEGWAVQTTESLKPSLPP
ncbi:putative nnf1 [Lyophyllum shimeji]|uniref:Nnf1 n=1 Tax=Lyophyllum shimeji TaxID=47721 RepID=A0A9P3PUY3_LYOSH|nr:putative nnf1 [Lyophyllum shimeji]